MAFSEFLNFTCFRMFFGKVKAQKRHFKINLQLIHFFNFFFNFSGRAWGRQAPRRLGPPGSALTRKSKPPWDWHQYPQKREKSIKIEEQYYAYFMLLLIAPLPKFAVQLTPSQIMPTTLLVIPPTPPSPWFHTYRLPWWIYSKKSSSSKTAFVLKPDL